MGEGSYFNFDLILERVGEKYRESSSLYLVE